MKTPKKKIDDETMRGLTPIAPPFGDEKASGWQNVETKKQKKTFDDPTMKHVANSPRPSRTKYDDETQRALAPIESNPPSAPISSIATSAGAETNASLRVSHVDPTMNMAPEASDAPLSAKKTMAIGNVQSPPSMTSPRAETIERRARPETIVMEPQGVPASATKLSREIVLQWSSERRSFQGADLSGMDLRDLDLRGLDLRGANLTGARLSGADLSRANLSGADFSRAAGERVVMDDADLRDFRCEDAQLTAISARRVAARGSVWDKSDVTDGTFEGADLARASFRGARLRNTRFVRADLSNVSFEHADLTSAAMLGATLLGTNLPNRGGR